MDINYLISSLDKIYPNARCSLDYKKNYELLIAVMLSAQTTDKAVNSVTKVLFKKYNSLVKLKKAKLKDIENIIHPLGMYKVKSKNILGIANKIKLPISKDRNELIKLPGVGIKVANVVLAELYHLPYIAVDTHVTRVSKRLKLVSKDDDVVKIEEKLTKIIPSNKIILVNHQLIEFGRNICRAKNPNCIICPFKKNKCKGDI